MTPAESWLLLLALLAITVGPVWVVCRAAERRHVPCCACARCMAGSVTWHPSRGPNNANDPVRLDSYRVAASPDTKKVRL